MEKDVFTHPKTGLTPDEYLELERRAEMRSEYLDGEMYAMPGVTREHSRIVINTITELNTQFLDRPCEVHGPELRVKASATGLYTYPDVLAFCGAPQFEDDRFDTLLNPQLIIEVLSQSTESYVRGKKFAHYRTIHSLHEYVLISHGECRIERFVRQPDGDWLYTETTEMDSSIELVSVACRLSLARVYHRVDFGRDRSEGREGSSVTPSSL